MRRSARVVGLAALLAGVAGGPALAIASATPGLEPHWRLIGPFRGGWGEMVVGPPQQPDTFYFGAAGGGVWKTQNAGRTWTSLFDKGPTAPIGALAVAPSNPGILYIGSGQPEPRYDVASGEGVFGSRDGGATWRALGLEKTLHIGKVWIDPADPNRVLVAAVGDFFGPNPERGVFRSTDGGASWAHTLAIDPDTGAVDLAADPADARTVIAAAWQARQYPWQSYFTQVAGPGSGLYKSSDGGLTWGRLGGEGWPAGPLGRISVATARTGESLRIYAVVSAAAGAGGLFRSDDGGGHWSRVNAEQAFTSYYASRITVDPADPDVVWLVGQSIRRCSDGGRTCEIVKGAPGGDDYHFVWINPAHPDHIATSSDQGVVVSVDAGRTWSSWYNQPTGQFYHLATDDRFPYRIYSGQQDSGTVGTTSRSDDGAIGWRDWRPVGGEERDYDIPDPDDPDIVYDSGLGGRVSRWDARTGQSANITPFPEPNYGRRQTSTDHHFVWVTPMAVSRVGPTTLYLAGEVVFASTDKGGHWAVISPDLTGKTPGAPRCDGDPAVADAKACGYGGIWSLTSSPRRAGELWVGTDDGLVQLTRDGGAHWSNVTPPGIPAWAKIATVDVSALADGVAYVAVDNQRQSDPQPHAYVTHDYGATWRDAAGDLPRGHFVSVVRADTVRPGLIFAGTDVGAFVSRDDGAHWSSLQGDLPTAWVRDFAVKGDDLVAATQGRAIWVLGDLALLRQDDGAPTRASARLFNPAEVVRVRANANVDTPIPPEEPAGENPPAGAVIDYALAHDARGPVTLDIRDGSGALVQRLSSLPSSPPAATRYFARAWLAPAAPLSTGAGLHRAVWNLRWSRPLAIAYGYSLATAAGRDTPITPEGALAVPGVYNLVLTVDGRSSTAPLTLKPDPRAPIDGSALQASLALSKTIGASLAEARRGYGEMASVRAQAGAAAAGSGDQTLVGRLEALGRLATPAGEADTFAAASGLLAAIETDLESSDLAPTEPQAREAAKAMARVDRLWSRWSAVREGELVSVNAALRQAGRRPIVVPDADKLAVGAPDGGEDLP